MTEEQKRKGHGERDKHNKHAYDKVTAKVKGEKKIWQHKKRTTYVMLWFLRKYLKLYRYEHTNKKQYTFGMMFSAILLHIWV